jgi:hypothetical protein
LLALWLIGGTTKDFIECKTSCCFTADLKGDSKENIMLLSAPIRATLNSNTTIQTLMIVMIKI